MESEWSRDNCLLLIEQFENYPELWNPNHGSYYDKIRKNDAWCAIAEAMNCSREEVKKKMDSLLSSFRRERARAAKLTGTEKGKDISFTEICK